MAGTSTLPLLPFASRTDLIEAGCDEAGRGCLAGPVTAAAVILPPGFTHPGLTDSKKISAPKRMALREVIQREAIAWAVGWVSAEEIGRINILNASILAMHRALDSLPVTPQAVAVDGNRFKPWRSALWATFVKGDGRLANIAAASILAKTYRDEKMEQLAALYPGYGWEVNKGYPTKEHRAAIAAMGATPEHRAGFRLLPEPTLFD